MVFSNTLSMVLVGATTTLLKCFFALVAVVCPMQKAQLFFLGLFSEI
jgi:hypothetical protein